jgi:hypothetical protein
MNNFLGFEDNCYFSLCLKNVLIRMCTAVKKDNGHSDMVM